MSNNDSAGLKCGCYLILFAIMVVVGGLASNYIIATIWHANISFALDMVIGALIGEVLIPAALVIYILKSTGVIK